jgi:hypothetical protein
MATLFTPDRAERVQITVDVTLAYGRGYHVRTVTFTDTEHGRKITEQCADLFLSACDLALAKEGR